jgi:hypothetical protein
MILLFKTDLACSHDVEHIAADLTKITGRNNWSVDIGDEDKVLRVLTEKDITASIQDILYNHGFTCETLK